MTHNSLTKLPNRIQLNNDCEFETNQTLVLIDIIDFSLINGTSGFIIGDMVLRELAAFLHAIDSNEYNISLYGELVKTYFTRSWHARVV